MRLYKRNRDNMVVSIYKDSNSDWVVSGGGHSPIWFDVRKFTMLSAWNFYIDIFQNDWDFEQ